MSLPFVSVIIPSIYRPVALLELVDHLGEQTYESFEIIVVEQSGDPDLVAQLEAKGAELRQRAVSLRVLAVNRPLGCPGARNHGIPWARGEIIVLFDDDDLPISRDWLATLIENFDDPNCIGVVGRICSRANGDDPAPRFPRLVQALGFRYSIFKYPRAYAFGTRRKEHLQLICPSGVALRRSLFEKVGGFDEGLQWGEDNTFSFKVAKAKTPEQYLAFDPRTGIWRRINFAGGLNRRSPRGWYLQELKHRLVYQHQVVGHYFPWRFRLFYPAFVLSTLTEVLAWIWDPDNANHSVRERMTASVSTTVNWPRVFLDVVRKHDCPTITRCPHLDFQPIEPNEPNERIDTSDESSCCL